MGVQLDADGLTRHLGQAGGQLAGLYLLSGDEPLLVVEAQDQLRAAARQAGYTERTSMVVDARSDWGRVMAATQTVSLFGDRQLLELKMPSGKPGKAGADALQMLATPAQTGASPEAVVVISVPKPDKATRESAWRLALAAVAVCVDIPTIDYTRLPAWIGARLARQGQRCDAGTLQWMAEKVEGNLLAAHQEIQKLGLLYPQGDLLAENVQRAVLNVARYDVFGLRDAMLAGDAARAVRMIEGLKAEGEALPLVLWAVGEEVRLLARLSRARASGEDTATLRRRLRLFGAHEKLAEKALSRVPTQAWPAAVQHACDIDRIVKGLSVAGRQDDPWSEITRLTLRVAAAR